jgi:hypothetical protein
MTVRRSRSAAGLSWKRQERVVVGSGSVIASHRSRQYCRSDVCVCCWRAARAVFSVRSWSGEGMKARQIRDAEF